MRAACRITAIKLHTTVNRIVVSREGQRLEARVLQYREPDPKREAVEEIATRNTAHVIGDLTANVIGLVEAESRPKKWDISDNITDPVHSASDHAAIGAELDI